MAKAVKLFLGKGSNPNHAEVLAQSEHGSWWKKTEGRWRAAGAPKPPSYESVYEFLGGRFVCVGNKPLDPARVLASGSVQGSANPLFPVDPQKLRVVLPMTDQERAMVEEKKALRQASKPGKKKAGRARTL